VDYRLFEEGCPDMNSYESNYLVVIAFIRDVFQNGI